ncbi:MAG: flagellar hook-length control protein FliK [Sulfuricurvum sp.]|nr:flagellar hook-length control protein FliK [Sulfuricurvum sp.]
MIDISADRPLRILLPNTNKALAEAIKNATPQELAQLKEGISVQSFLTSLFNDKITSSKSDTLLLDILKNSPLFKNMGNFNDSLESLLKELKIQNPLTTQTTAIEHYLSKNGSVDPQNLKYKLVQSGIFLESKLAALLENPHLLEESLQNDLKANLLLLNDELRGSEMSEGNPLLEKVDKLLMQIDYYQLVSLLEHSNTLYFPFSWDQLQEGSVSFKKSGEEKFYCEIDLKLREYGELTLRMGLYDINQIDIQIVTEKPALKTLFQENLQELRSLMSHSGLTVRKIRLSTMDELSLAHPNRYENTLDDSNFSFEVKV